MTLPQYVSNRRFAGASVALAMLLALRSYAADPVPQQATEELLRIAPANSAIVLAIEGGDRLVADFASAPLVKRLEKAGLGLDRVGDEPKRRWRELNEGLTAALGLDVHGLSREIFGVATVFAYAPGAREADDAGVMLVRARSAEELSRTLQNLFRSRKKQPRERTHAGVKYWIEPEGDRPMCLATLGPIGVATQNEAALKKIVEASQGGPGWLGVDQVGAMRRATPPGVFQLYMLPRLLDDRIPEAKPKDAGEAAVVGVLLGAWRLVKWTSLSTGLDGNAKADWQFELALDEPPPEDGKAAAPSPISAMPGILMTATVRLNAALLSRWTVDLAKQADPDGVRQAGSFLRNLFMGLDPVADVLQSLGPRLAVAVAKGLGPLPDLLMALEIQPQKPATAAKKPMATEVVEQSIRFALVLIAFEAGKDGKQEWKLGVETVGDARVHYAEISPGLPGVEPSFAVHDGWVVAASSRSAMKKMLAAKPTAANGPPDAVRIECKAIMAYLNEHPSTALFRGAEGWHALEKIADAFPVARVRTQRQGSVHRLTLDWPTGP